MSPIWCAVVNKLRIITAVFPAAWSTKEEIQTSLCYIFHCTKR